MRYVALFRGINVGGHKKVDMKKLRSVFEALGLTAVSTYINSGNVLFTARDNKKIIRQKIEARLKKEWGVAIAVLVKTESEMKKIAGALPKEWRNDAKQRADVAYLFPEVDKEAIVKSLPFKKEYVRVGYVKGAVYWQMERSDYGRSRLNKLLGYEGYKFMTIRNINTARFLAGER